MRFGAWPTIGLAVVLAMGGVALAQIGFGGFNGSYRPLPNIPYDGRFTFVRVRYDPAPGGYWPGRRPSWIHGYPFAETMRRVLPDVQFLNMDVSDPVFHSFFEIGNIAHFPQA